MNTTSDALVIAEPINTENTVIALSTGIGIFTCLLCYYLKLSLSFVGNPSDKIYYYLSCCVCIFPLIMYSLQLLNIYLINNNTYVNNTLLYFDIEWIITTPILLIKLGQLAEFKLYEYILMVLVNELLFISGYIFHIAADLAVAMTFFGIGATAYIGILSGLFYKYCKLKENIEILARRTTAFLIYSTVVLWSIYPLIALLNKFKSISVDHAVIAYVTLDSLSKGVFTCILLGSREIRVRRSSLTAYVTRRALRIAPELNTETSIITDNDSVDTFCRKVNMETV